MVVFEIELPISVATFLKGGTGKGRNEKVSTECKVDNSKLGGAALLGALAPAGAPFRRNPTVTLLALW